MYYNPGYGADGCTLIRHSVYATRAATGFPQSIVFVDHDGNPGILFHKKKQQENPAAFSMPLWCR